MITVSTRRRRGTEGPDMELELGILNPQELLTLRLRLLYEKAGCSK